MIGWHFLRDSGKLRDGRPAPPDGEWLEHEGDVIPCKQGLHMSESVIDALRWASGALLCRVELEGDLVPHGDPIDKWVGRRRKILARVDASRMLRRFAADQALSVSHLWKMPDIVHEYLTTLDESLREAAWSAAWLTPAARGAAHNATRAVAHEAAWSAAWSAAGASGSTPRAAALELARKELDKRALQLFSETVG